LKDLHENSPPKQPDVLHIVPSVGDNELTTVLEANNISKIYRMGKIHIRALRGVSLKVQDGDYISILGPSGSGKTTLLNMFGALDRPTRGGLIIEGQPITTLSDNKLAEIRRRVGFVFQFFNLIPRLTAYGNVELPLIINEISKSERKVKTSAMLESVGLAERLDHKPGELSGGEQQRVAIARALVSDPSYILLDEPTGNLDTRTAADIMEIISSLNTERNVTIVVITHDTKVASHADKIVNLVDGQIASEEVN
jgi:putative ABC transport system ATP-binding protein